MTLLLVIIVLSSWNPFQPFILYQMYLYFVYIYIFCLSHPFFRDSYCKMWFWVKPAPDDEIAMGMRVCNFASVIFRYFKRFNRASFFLFCLVCTIAWVKCDKFTINLTIKPTWIECSVRFHSFFILRKCYKVHTTDSLWYTRTGDSEFVCARTRSHNGNKWPRQPCNRIATAIYLFIYYVIFSAFDFSPSFPAPEAHPQSFIFKVFD